MTSFLCAQTPGGPHRRSLASSCLGQTCGKTRGRRIAFSAPARSAARAATAVLRSVR